MSQTVTDLRVEQKIRQIQNAYLAFDNGNFDNVTFFQRRQDRELEELKEDLSELMSNPSLRPILIKKLRNVFQEISDLAL